MFIHLINFVIYLSFIFSVISSRQQVTANPKHGDTSYNKTIDNINSKIIVHNNSNTVVVNESSTCASTTADHHDERAVHKSHSWEIYCKYQPNSYDCGRLGSFRYRFYYDIKLEDCRRASFGRCENNLNRFNSRTDCRNQCRDDGLKKIDAKLSESIYCRLQPDFGTCNDYHPSWYFDVSERACKGFSYSGCGGNMNRFASAQQCTAVCGIAIKYENVDTK